jgi:lipoate-protein ligase A
MLLIDAEAVTDPRTNLAIEEHILRNLKNLEDSVFLYINEPSIILGRNQNPFEEVNLQFAEAQRLHIVRRLSGGGAVYHDLGNLNFSFITNQRKEDFHNFRKFTAPAIRVLRRLGVNAQLSSRSDILVEGRKISGNAQYIAAGRMLTHGTLLFDTDLSSLTQALKVDANAIDSKSIKSVRSRVANISEFLKAPLDMENFRLRLLRGIFAGLQDIPRYRLAEDDWASIRQIAAERYQTWEWNFGHSPPFSLQKTHLFAFGEITARLDIAGGMIRSIQFSGDSREEYGFARLEQALAGVRYERQHIQAAVSELHAAEHWGSLPADEFLQTLENWLI